MRDYGHLSKLADNKRDSKMMALAAKLGPKKAAAEFGVNPRQVRSIAQKIERRKTKEPNSGRTHLLIPDTQCKPGIRLDYLDWLGRYIMHKRPDVIVHIGDHWDMPSLSSYDKGKKSFEGRRYKADIKSGNEGMRRLLQPLKDHNENAGPEDLYYPEMHFCMGNHEIRIERAVENQAELEGVIGLHDLYLDDWQVHDFLKPAVIDGVAYAHYFYNPMSGRPYGGKIASKINNIGFSFSMGHQQGLDIGLKVLSNGEVVRGLVAGSYYEHDEDYKGHQGNHHWRGVILKNEVADGNYCLTEVSLDFLKRRYQSGDVEIDIREAA